MRPVDHPVMRAVRRAKVERARIAIGVSGGADSVALLRAAALMRRGTVPVVLHLDHGLRSESTEDAEWVKRLATTLGLEAVIERRDVRQFGAEQAFGLEEAARRCRYDFLCQVAAERQCKFVAVAHTADDQAETILHHLVRGTGLAGLRGMPASRELNGVTLIRPLLCVTRADVLDFLGLLEQPFLTDETNADKTFTRNRIRHSLLPMLRDQFNPKVSEALARLGEQAQAACEIVEQHAGHSLAEAIVQREPDVVTLNAAALAGGSVHLVREALRLLFAEQDWPRQQMGFDDWNRLAELAHTAAAPRSISLPGGMRAAVRRGVVTIERNAT